MKNFFRNSYVRDLVVGVIILILPTVWSLIKDFLEGRRYFTTLFSFFQGVIKVLRQAITLELYQIIILLVLCFFAPLIIRFIYFKIHSRVSHNQSILRIDDVALSYTSDNFNGFKYSWRWTKKYNGDYEIVDMMCHCPKCDNYIVNERCIGCLANYNYGMLKEEDLKLRIVGQLKYRWDNK